MKRKSSLKKSICKHDYLNATPVGKIDHVCPLCKEILDPMEWGFHNIFEKTLGVKFIDVTPSDK